MDSSGGGGGRHNPGRKASYQGVVILQVGNDEDLNWDSGTGDGGSRVDPRKEKRIDGDRWVPGGCGKSNTSKRFPTVQLTPEEKLVSIPAVATYLWGRKLRPQEAL